MEILLVSTSTSTAKTLRFELETLSVTPSNLSMQRNIEYPRAIHKDGDGDASFQLKSDSLPHAHAQTTKTFYKHQDSAIMKAQELNDKVFRTNSDIQDLPSKISSLSREIVSKLSR
ncbi:hypothetical protein Tco_0424766 [Tanacetum coccineum]